MEENEQNEHIVLEPLSVICGRHGEMFKPKWPLGYSTFTITLLQAALADPDFEAKVVALKEDPAIPDVTTPTQAINYLLASIPLCCRVTPAALYDVYMQINTAERVWPARHCTLCGKHGPGCVFRRTPPNPKKERLAPVLGTPFKHVCLRCVCFGQKGKV